MTGADLRVEEGQASVGVTTSEGDSYNLTQEFCSLLEQKLVQQQFFDRISQFLFFGVLSTGQQLLSPSSCSGSDEI